MELKGQYEELVLRNGPRVALVENALRSLSYLIPGRLKDSDFLAELVLSSLNLVGVYHDSLFQRHSWNDPGASLLNRYVGQLSVEFPLYKKVAYLLVILRHIEIATEMGGRKYFGEKSKLPIAFTLELLKVVCRLVLLKISGGKMVPDQTLPDPGRKDSSFSLPMSTPAPQNQPFSHLSFWKGSHTQKLHPKVSVVKSTPIKQQGDTPALSFVTDRALLSAKEPKGLVTWSNIKLIAEILFILRPLIYVLAIIKFGEKSWRAWSLSFLIELTSFQLLRSQKNLSQIEKDELKKRAFHFVYYLLRGALFHDFTKDIIESGSTSRIGSLPLINLVTGSLKDYSSLWEKYYFYSAST